MWYERNVFCVIFRETEERAQAAEERATQAEAELMQALRGERIRALERSASRATMDHKRLQTKRPAAAR